MSAMSEASAPSNEATAIRAFSAAASPRTQSSPRSVHSST